MIRNFTRRSVSSVITLWVVTLIVFFLLRVAPGDAVIGALSQSPGEGMHAGMSLALTVLGLNSTQLGYTT